MTAVLLRDAPGTAVVDLFADAPAHDPELAAYLLAAYVDEFPAGTVFLAVVDPGVGGARAAGVLEADGRWFVAPDNGLLAIVARRAARTRWWEITWRPARLSASFHGRDLFAPVAAMLARGEAPPGVERPLAAVERPDWPDDLARVVHIDGFGNAMTGLRAAMLGADAELVAGGTAVRRARVFSDVAPGTPFWYENANGLAEIAVNRGRADAMLSLALGDAVEFTRP